MTKPPASSHRNKHTALFDLPHPFDQSATRADPSEVEMPWFWGALRAKVTSNTPTYERNDKLTIMLAVVVVNGPSATVSGLGVAGTF